MTPRPRRKLICCAKRETGHDMSCRWYVGPLTHTWVSVRDGLLGGTDYHCACGGWFRQGGFFGHGDGSDDATPVCPDVNQTHRNDPTVDTDRTTKDAQGMN